MKSQELPIKQTMNVILKPDTETLEEVVVLGYGSGKKIGSIVGSVAKVNSEKLSAKPVANAMDALQGQVSGLQVYTSSGEPGSSSSSYIRGVGLSLIHISCFSHSFQVPSKLPTAIPNLTNERRMKG